MFQGRPFLRPVFRKFAVLAAVCAMFAAAGKRTDLVPGLSAGFLWISLNAFLMARLVGWSMSGGADRKKIYLVCFVKFPVLYVLGFLVLLTPWVTLGGVFAAFTLFFVAAAAHWAQSKFIR